jgi:hypothetical protein
MLILALAEPKNKRQFRSFLGFMNFYRQLWYHQSHIITPLAAITSDKAKWVWGPEQKKAFKEIRNTISHQVLLRYPDFSKPFDIFRDASDYQLGAVIAQESWPIAFYSKKTLHNATIQPWRRNFSPLLRLPNTIDIFFLVDTAHFIVITRTLDFKTSSQNVSVGGVLHWSNLNIPLYIVQEKTIA